LPNDVISKSRSTKKKSLTFLWERRYNRSGIGDTYTTGNLQQPIRKIEIFWLLGKYLEGLLPQKGRYGGKGE